MAEVESRIADLAELKSGLRALGLRVTSEEARGYFHTFTLRRCKVKGNPPEKLFSACRYKPR